MNKKKVTISIKKNTAFVSSEISNIVGEVAMSKCEAENLASSGGYTVDISESKEMTLEEVGKLASNNTVILAPNASVHLYLNGSYCDLSYSGVHKLKVSSELIEDITMVMDRCSSNAMGDYRCSGLALDGQGKPWGKLTGYMAAAEKEEMIEYLMKKYNKRRVSDVLGDSRMGVEFQMPVEIIKE